MAVSQSSPGQSLGTASVPNLRDIGGYVARDGATVRPKVLYRADQLNPISPEDRISMALLRLKTSFNLRRAE
jgi:protein-tyrosine phosphatase